MSSFSLTISGQVPSKKNNKRILKNSRTGSRFIANSKRFNDWYEMVVKEMTLISKSRKFRNTKYTNPLGDDGFL